MSEEKTKITFKERLHNFFSGIGSILCVLILLFVVFTIFRGDVFLTLENIQNLIRTSAVNGVCALGLTCTIICGGVDLSSGSLIGAGVMLLALFTSTQTTGTEVGLMSIPLAILATLAFCLIMGFINGFLINDGHLPPFIATLAMQIVIRNVIFFITECKIIAELPETIKNWGLDTILNIPVLAFVWIVLAIVTWLIFKFTPFGRNIFAVGSNPETARLSGISLRQTRCGAWMYSALMSGIAGILLCARLGNGIPSAGTGYETDAIAASVVGGASMSGGEGSVLGTFIGTLITQTIRNGGNILGINTYLLEIVVGAVILFCVLFDKNSGTN